MAHYVRLSAQNIVVETLETDGNIAEMFHPDLRWVLADAGVKIGDVQEEDGSFSTPAAPDPIVPVPESISDRQFFQQLAIDGLITQADALAAVKTGSIPAELQTFIDALPSEQQFGAEMLVSGATVFQRNHPTTIALGTAYGMTSDQLDTLWIAAAAL